MKDYDHFLIPREIKRGSINKIGGYLVEIK